MIVKRKLWVEFEKNVLDETFIKDTFPDSCETSTVYDRECSRRSLTITNVKLNKVSFLVKMNYNRALELMR